MFRSFALALSLAVAYTTSGTGTEDFEGAFPARAQPHQPGRYADDSLCMVLSLPAEEVPVEHWLSANGWEVQRGNVELFSIESGALLMKNIDASTVIGKKLNRAIDPDELPLIEFDVMVKEIPIGADVTTRSMDDAAFRLFILFDRGGGFLSPPETIGYVWDSTMEPGETGRSARFDRIRYIVIGSGEDGLGEWITYRRNLIDDYRALFGTENTPDIIAIALKCDSNHSGTAAASSVRWIRLKTVRAEHR
jgi:hypothetical protein